MKMRINLWLAAAASVLLWGCKDNGGGAIIPVVKTHGYWILGEGSFGSENSTLYYCDLATRTVSDRFTEANPGEKVGNTANDMKIYGSKLYIAVDASNQVLVVDAASGRIAERIDMGQADGMDREPRAVACAAGKVFVSLYSGEVARIDTTTFAVDYTPYDGSFKYSERIVASKEEKLVVANSGWGSGNTVTVIDIPTFTKVDEITVPTNPYWLAATSDGTVYLATWTDYATGAPAALHKLDLTAKSYETIPNVEVQRIAIHGGTLYGVNTGYDPTTYTPSCSLVKVDLATRAVETMIEKQEGSFNGVNVNPINGYLYVMNVATDYITSTILPFDENGKALPTIAGVGNAANTAAFVNTTIK
ncbi:MAG: hypothetical protein K2G93_02305 [Rikenella sp.]|nr:hypothetical protein [Rikenella sp.]